MWQKMIVKEAYLNFQAIFNMKVGVLGLNRGVIYARYG